MDWCEIPYLCFLSCHYAGKKFPSLKEHADMFVLFFVLYRQTQHHLLRVGRGIFILHNIIAKTQTIIPQPRNTVTVICNSLRYLVNRVALTQMYRHEMELHFPVLFYIFRLVQALAQIKRLLASGRNTSARFPLFNNRIKIIILYLFRTFLLFINNFYCLTSHLKKGNDNGRNRRRKGQRSFHAIVTADTNIFRNTVSASV